MLRSVVCSEMCIRDRINAFKGDLDKPVIFVCNLGTDSSKIASSLKKDLKEVYVINGGINAWKSVGFPIVN